MRVWLHSNPARRVRSDISRQTDLGDSIMTAIVLAPFLPAPVRFTDLGRLRVQECERVRGPADRVDPVRRAVVEDGRHADGVPFRAARRGDRDLQDHRMAMCFAILGLKVPGHQNQNPACVKKTFPNFFQKLAAPPPAGLGRRDSRRPTPGRRLSGDELVRRLRTQL